MPKRVPTPPPGDDEPRYLSVVHPYVPDGHCNMELPKDRQDFARWVACCIDARYIYAFFHKPSARDMVILEVARECPQLDRLLGEHRWGEFLRRPNEQDKTQVSQVFYCTYSTGRQVQKNGWKRIFVEDSWFDTWSAKNHFIEFPYPETHFCDVPVEDQTNHPMCRPLPGVVKPARLPTAPAPVVGSDEWISDKQLPVAKPLVGAWGKRAPKALMPVGNAWKAAIATSAPAIPGVKKQPAVGGGTIAVKASDILVGLPMPPADAPNGWAETPTASGRNTPARNASSPLPAAQTQAPDVPPGLSDKTVWNGGGASYPARPPGIPALPTIETAPSLNRDNTSSTSWSSSGRSSSTGTDIILTPENAPDDNPYEVQVTLSDSMEMSMDQLTFQDDDGQDEIDPNLAELDAIAPGAWDEPTGAQVTWTGYTGADGGTWDDTPEDAESFWNQSNRETKETDKIICNAHGIICKKGICREYSKQMREAERAKQNNATDPKRGRGRGRGKDRAFGSGRGRGFTDRGGAPPNPFRGRGAPVNTNWRGVPRAIVSVAAVEQREYSKDTESVAETPNTWGKTADAWSPAVEDAPEPSEDGWGGTVASFDPWAIVPEKPKPKPQSKAQAQPQRNQKPQSKSQSQSKRNQNANAKTNAKTNAKASTDTNTRTNTNTRANANTSASANAINKLSWADQMETLSAAGYPDNDDDGLSSISSKWGRNTKAPKSSTSGWGTVDEKPWSQC